MPVRIAVIGASHWHAFFDAAYLKHLSGMCDVTLAAVHDVDQAVLASHALPDVPNFSDHREMLHVVRPDFVLVLGRHDQMAAYGHDVADARLAFLIEKPAGLNSNEVVRLAEHVAAAGVFAGVPLFQRYHPFVSRARQLLRDGAFGTLSHFHFRSVRGSSQRYLDWGSPWMLDKALSGGGCLRNIGTHGIDLFQHILDEEAVVVAAQISSSAFRTDVEDAAFVHLRSQSGVLGAIEVATTFPGKGAEASWTLSGRDGLLTMSAGKMHWVTSAGDEVLDTAASEPLPAIALRDALTRWRLGKQPLCSIADCARVMRRIDRAYELAATPVRYQ